MEDQAIATRIIARYGDTAAKEADLRAFELESSGEFVAALQWQRVAELIRDMQVKADKLL